MSDNIIPFPVQLDPALSAYLAIENLEYILDRNSGTEPLTYTREDGRITGSLAISTAARVYVSDRLDSHAQQLALDQATAALPGVLERARAYLQADAQADGLTIRDSQHCQEATYECWHAVDVAIARGDRDAARQWSDVAVTLRQQVVDPLEADISLVYDE